MLNAPSLIYEDPNHSDLICFMGQFRIHKIQTEDLKHPNLAVVQ